MGQSLPPDALGARLSCGAETKTRTLSCGFRVLPILSFIPTFCLISGAWKAGKKQAWPSHPPSKHNHIAQKNSVSATAEPPPPHASSFRHRETQAHKDTLVSCLFPIREQVLLWIRFPNEDSHSEEATHPPRGASACFSFLPSLACGGDFPLYPDTDRGWGASRRAEAGKSPLATTDGGASCTFTLWSAMQLGLKPPFVTLGLTVLEDSSPTG